MLSRPRLPNRLFIVVDGYDLHDVADELLAGLQAVIAGGTWRAAKPVLFDDRYPPEPGGHPDDLPEWNLGLALDLTDDDAWKHDFAAVAAGVGELAARTGLEFIVAVGRDKDIGEDVDVIDGADPDVGAILRALG